MKHLKNPEDFQKKISKNSKQYITTISSLVEGKYPPLSISPNLPLLKHLHIPKYTEEDIAGLRKSAQIVTKVLWEMINLIRPGMSTTMLDKIAGKTLEKLDARSAPKLEGFPGYTCISVNEIIAHGIPSKKKLEYGDRINIDVSAEHNGYFGDVAYTIIVDDNGKTSNKLLDCAKKATCAAANMSVHGTPFNAIGKRIETLARMQNFTVVKNLCSHGVGKSLHAYPRNILNYYDPEETDILQEGMVIAWEPYISTGACRAIEQQNNDWNLTTHNQSDVAQFEHTVLVTRDKPEILTLPD